MKKPKDSDKLQRERDEAREALSEIAFYLSAGMGDETTTAQQYKQRIQEGIKMLTEPIVNLWKQAESERDKAIAARKTSAADWLNQIEQANSRVSRALQQAALAERERDEAREALSEIAFYLSMVIEDETTTAQQYKQRIQEGIKMLTEPIANLWKQAEIERDEAREQIKGWELKWKCAVDMAAKPSTST